MPSGQAGHSGDTATVRCEEGGDDVNQHGPYVRGYTRVTMAGTERRSLAKWIKSLKQEPLPVVAFRTEKEISDNYTRILKDIERVLGMEEIDVNSLFTDR